jgi:hypothetical protein
VRLDQGDYGVAEDAFPVVGAEPVLAVLQDSGALVLGGDLYEIEGSHPRPTGSSWYYEGADTQASISEARRTLQQRWVASDWYVTFVWR